MIKRVGIKVFLFLFLLIYPLCVKAAYSNIGLSGGSTIVGNSISINLYLNSTDSKLVSFGGTLSYDSSYLELQGCSSTSALTYTGNGNKFAFVDYSTNGISSGNIGTCSFITKKVGNTYIGVEGATSTDNGKNLSTNVTGASISINNPPSSNNNLSSLAISPSSINFSPGNTNYNVTVGADVSSVNVTGQAADPKASVTGLGTRQLNYGNNSIAVTATAENGAQKTYTINVNRKDNRSGNNNLASLYVSNGTLNPGFNKDITNYSMEVPFEVAKLDIGAQAEDPKSNVYINNPDLISEEITNVEVTVVAENGSSKVYVISVKRGKDPSLPLSTNNYLANLSVSVGMLSPAFDKEKLNYAVYLPYEIREIYIDVQVEDTKYAKIEKIENNNLSIGNNLFKYIVTAEDGSVRTYTVTVVRNKSMDDVKVSENTYLKSLVLSKGSLTTKFNKKINVYYYKGKDASIKKAEPEIKENTVSTYKINNAFIIIVETPSGEKGFYLLIKHKNNNSILLPIIIIVILVLVILFLLYSKYKDKFKKLRKKEKNTKK